MSRLVFWIVRFALAVFAYVLAALAASLFAGFLTIGQTDIAGDPFAVIHFLLAATLAAGFIGRLSFLAALPLILFAEYRAIRTWTYYALAGAFSAFAALALVPWRDSAGMADTGFLPLAAAAGAVAGIVYWLVAGRSAGIARPISPASSGS